MNDLAHVVHHLMSNCPIAIASLPKAEQEALESLRPVLGLSARDLALFIREQQVAIDWGDPPPIEETSVAR